MIRLRISVIFLIGLFSGIVSYLIILGLSFIGLSYKMGIYVPSQFYFSYFDVDRRWNSSQIVRWSTNYPNLLDSNFSKISKSNYMWFVYTDTNDFFFVCSNLRDGYIMKALLIRSSISAIMYSKPSIWGISICFIFLQVIRASIVIVEIHLNINNPLLRYKSTLNSKIKVHGHSYEQQRIYYCTWSIQQQCILPLNPWWLTGFVDGEGCWSISIYRDKNLKTGWRIIPVFIIGLHARDLFLLEKIKSYFYKGRIKILKNNRGVNYYVNSIEDLTKFIIPHFEKYPLLTQKKADFELFKQIVIMMKNKEHLNEQGVRKIVAILASMNLGLSNSLKKAFSDVVPVERPLIINKTILDPDWVAGFSSAEGCFFIHTKKFGTNSFHLNSLCFIITQSERDKELMISLIEYLNCGNINKKSKAVDFKVTKFSDIMYKIIPFFKKYPIEGVKLKDFHDFCKVADMVKDKKHLTKEGLEHIHQIKKQMNKKRQVY